MTLKVCLVTPEFLPVWGGTGSYCIELARSLSSKVEVHVATVDRSGESPVTNSTYPSADKIVVHYLTKSSPKDTFLFNGKMQLAVLQKLPALIKQNNFDLIHSNFPAMPDLLFRAFSRSKTKTLTTVHTNIEMQRAATSSSAQASKIENSEKMTRLLMPYILRSQKFFISREKNFVFVSKFVQSKIHEKYEKALKNSHQWIINNGVDTEQFSPKKAERFREFFPSLDKASSIVLFSGRLIALKGVSVLAEAMQTVVAQNKSAHFVFAGAGSTELLIYNLKKFGVPEDKYSILGPVDRANMSYLYAKAEMLVLPSFIESFPLCVLEAMSCGTPVIASNVGGLPEIITSGQDGLLFEAGQPSQLAANIIYLLENKSKARNIASKGMEKVHEKFSAKKMAADTLNVYREILNGYT
jgi:glycosyltransferase involved in cell wall biosynthesis